jgi:hypothetical protein
MGRTVEIKAIVCVVERIDELLICWTEAGLLSWMEIHEGLAIGIDAVWKRRSVFVTREGRRIRHFEPGTGE